MLDSNEGFLAKPKQKNLSVDNQKQPNKCPHGSNSYTDPQTGATNCTKGPVKFNQPDKPGFCTLTPGTGLPSCSEYLAEYNQKMEAKFCFPTMPRYYENESSKSNSGCASGVNADASAPGPGTDSCKIYTKEQDNLIKIDSCFNKKAEYNFANSAICKQTKCKTAIVNFGTTPAVISSTNIDPSNYRPTTCYEKESALRYLRTVLKGDLLQGEIDRINSGQAQEICGYVPPAPVCNPDKAAYYVGLTGNGYIQLSQIVIKDMNGINVAPKGTIGDEWTSPAYNSDTKPQNAIDGTEAVRAYPNIYHSTDDPGNSGITNFTVTLEKPTCISEIIIYGRSDCCADRHKDKTIWIVGKDRFIWTSPKTIDQQVQSFKIPASLWK
jgi:hypothetical protein